jgi:hypothetical protein
MGGGMGKTLSAVDVYVKKTIVGDAIKLVKKRRDRVNTITNFRTLTKIYPNE